MEDLGLRRAFVVAPVEKPVALRPRIRMFDLEAPGDSVPKLPGPAVRGSFASVERTIRMFETFEAAEAADLEEWAALTGDERLAIGESLRRDSFAGGAKPIERVLRMGWLGPEHAADD